MNSSIWSSLVETLLHTFWQSALVAGALYLALRMIPARYADLRYGLCAGGLALTLVFAVAGWSLSAPPLRPAALVQVSPLEPETLSQTVATVTSAIARAGAQSASLASINPWRWTAILWLTGVVICLGRTAVGVFQAELLRRRSIPRDEPQIIAIVEALRARFRIPRPIRLLFSREVGVPCVMGALHPVLLLPTAVLSGLSTDQLRAILAHELAHLRRCDYVVNLGQMLLESLLFFNPFVWWISHQVRLEREACCDQEAARECPSAKCYVEGLVSILESRYPTGAWPSSLLAIRGTERQALERAQRLLIPGYRPTLRVGWHTFVAALLVCTLALTGFRSAQVLAQAGNAAVAADPTKQGRPRNPLIFGKPELDGVTLLGLPKEEALKRLGEPEQILGPEAGYQTYEYGQRHGLSVVFHSSKLVQYVVRPNSKAQTAEGIHIGSPLGAVTMHYGNFTREETVTEWFAGLESKVLYGHPESGKFKINYQDAGMTFMLDAEKAVKFIWVGWIWNSAKAE